LLLGGIGNHDGTLSSPQKSGANTKPGTSKEIKAGNAGVNRDQQADGVDGISDPSKGERPPYTELVDKGTTKETKDRESAVERRVLCSSQ
jgi:hypothetical protein